MALTVNTNIINDTDQYLLDAKNVKGTYVVVTTETERDNLPAATIVIGSLCCVTGTEVEPINKFYQYNGNSWEEVKLVTTKTSELIDDIGLAKNADLTELQRDTTKTFEDLTILVTNHIDATNNPHAVTKKQVGLENVDNTADIDKPVSIATQEAINMHVFDTDNPHMVDKVHVGLGKVNNTSDLNKPISKATQRAIDDLNNIDYSLVAFDTSWVIPESAESRSIVGIAMVDYAKVGYI